MMRMNTNMPKQQKILIVSPAWVGDMVMSQVLYKLLKEQNPDVIIDVVAPKHSGPLAARMPEIRDFIELPLGHGAFGLKTRYEIGKRLRAQQYDQAIVLPNSFKSAFIPFFFFFPKRTGWLGEMRLGLLNDFRLLDKQKYPLMIERFAALAFDKHHTLPDKLPWPNLHARAEDVKKACAQYNITLNEQKILALCPGAEFGPAKRWPAEHFAIVAKTMLDQGWQVWLFGSPKEQPQADTIQEVTDNRCVNLVGKTALADAIDLMSCATAVVSNDSGLMHIAAALKRPLVVMYGSSSPSFTPPLSEKVRVLNLHLECSPCFKRTCPLEHLKCLQDLKPQQVIASLQELVS